MESEVRDLIDAGSRLFSKRENLLSFWQEIALNFNPIGADFTSTLTLGDEYASDLMTSYPLIMARELTDQFSSMLRPSDQQWAKMSVEGLKEYEGKAWLEWATKLHRRAMYDRAAQFVPTAKAGDRDFGLYGQAVMTVDVMPDRSSLLYRKWHLRDTVWCDGIANQVEAVHRNWKPEAGILARTFGREKLHQSVLDKLDRDPYFTVPCRHIVVPAEQYRGEKFRTPLVSLYVDCDNGHVMEARGVRINSYVIPRWQRVEGTQYACSPATVCALPEARLLQAMTFTLLEAGEKYTNPPMLATQEMIRGEIDVRAGGITWVAAEYDERTGEVLRPLTTDKSGMPLGLELQNRSEMMIKAAFYLDKLDLPTRGPEMTAYEVGQRVQQYIRNALPLFEPVEVDYNGALCERTMDVLLENGAFGRPDSIPRSLQNEDVQFKFTSPLRDAIDKQKGEIFVQASQIIAQAASLDPSSPALVDAAEALRDTLEGIGVPMPWMRSQDDVNTIIQQQAKAAQQQQVLAAMQQGSEVVKNLGGVQSVAA